MSARYRYVRATGHKNCWHCAFCGLPICAGCSEDGNTACSVTDCAGWGNTAARPGGADK